MRCSGERARSWRRRSLNRTISWSCSITKKWPVFAMRYIISRLLFESLNVKQKHLFILFLDQRFWSVGPASSGLATIAVISPGPGRLSRSHSPAQYPCSLPCRVYFPRGSLTFEARQEATFALISPAFANRINLALSGLTGQTGLTNRPEFFLHRGLCLS